eukprot:896780-Lingulodinium_polyedra.AAC.1
MTRSSRRFVAAAANKSHARTFHALAGFRSARGVRERAVCEPAWRRSVDSTASRRSISQTL